MDANDLRPQARDLFGQIPVSIRDLRLWLWSVPVWFRYTSRPSAVEAYLRGYDVAGKVARAKAEGRLGDVFGDERCPHCGAMFESGTEARLDDLERENAELRALLGRPREADRAHRITIHRQQVAELPDQPAFARMPFLDFARHGAYFLALALTIRPPLA